MSEKRFVYGVIKGSRQAHIKDCHNCKSATIDVYDDNIKYFVDKLNEQQAIIEAKDQEIEESKITIQLYETDVSMRDNFIKSKGLYDEFLQCILE